PSVADGVSTPGGWLMVGAVENNSCAPGPLDAVGVTHFAGGQWEQGAVVELASYASSLRLLPRPGGAWLLVYDQLDGTVMYRLDAQGHIEIGPLPVTPPYGQAPVGVDALDGGLVIALADYPTTGNNIVTIVVTDEQGAIISSTSLDPGQELSLGSAQ